MNVFRDIDLKPNLISYADFSSRGISGLGSGFISKALKEWDENQALIMPSALRKIETLDSETRASSFDTGDLSFVCRNKESKPLLVKLLPSNDDSILPSISVASGRLRKVYEVTYSTDLKKLYLNLTNVCVRFGEDEDPIYIHRIMSCKIIELRMKRKDIMVSIRIVRNQDSYNSHFMFYDEQYFLRDLADLENYSDVNAVWEYLLLRSRLDFRELCLEINIYQGMGEKEENIGKLTMFNGKLFSYQKKSKDIKGNLAFYQLKEKELCLLPEGSSPDDNFFDNTDYVRELVFASNKKNE